MDLSTMGAKLEEGMYKDRFAFEADFHLMIENAKTYNGSGSYVHNEAIILETFFEKRESLRLFRALSYHHSEWSIINKTLEAADRAHPSTANSVIKPSLQRRPAPAVLDASKHPAGGPAALPSSARAGPSVEPTTPAPTPSASRPVIKLKVNAQSTATSSQSEATGSMPAPKAKNRKSKTADAPFLDAIASLEPPPPYIDDGSHDILQEVIAIEREKKHRSMVEKDREKPSANGATGKRKKADSTFDEDDILALATPSKKEKVSPPGPSTSKPKSIPPPAPSKPSQAVPSKSKKDKHVDPTVTSKPSSDLHRASAKDKEKDVQSSGSTTPTSVPNQSSKPKKLPVSVTPINERKCRDLLRIIQKMPDTAIFLRPVDPVLDGCPT